MLHQVVRHSLLDREDRFSIRQTGLYMARQERLLPGRKCDEKGREVR